MKEHHGIILIKKIPVDVWKPKLICWKAWRKNNETYSIFLASKHVFFRITKIGFFWIEIMVAKCDSGVLWTAGYYIEFWPFSVKNSQHGRFFWTYCGENYMSSWLFMALRVLVLKNSLRCITIVILLLHTSRTFFQCFNLVLQVTDSGSS